MVHVTLEIEGELVGYDPDDAESVRAFERLLMERLGLRHPPVLTGMGERAPGFWARLARSTRERWVRRRSRSQVAVRAWRTSTGPVPRAADEESG